MRSLVIILRVGVSIRYQVTPSGGLLSVLRALESGKGLYLH